MSAICLGVYGGVRLTKAAELPPEPDPPPPEEPVEEAKPAVEEPRRMGLLAVFPGSSQGSQSSRGTGAPAAAQGYDAAD